MCSTVEKRVVQQYRVLFSLPHHATTHTFRKNLVQKSGAALDRSPGECQVISIKKNIKNLQLKKKIKTLPALPPPSNRYAQTAAPSSLPACATDLFLFRHFSLASPGKCQVNLLQKKENKTQNTKKQQRLALYLSISTKALPQGPTVANTFTHKQKQKQKLYHPPRSRTESRPS